MGVVELGARQFTVLVRVGQEFQDFPNVLGSTVDIIICQVTAVLLPQVRSSLVVRHGCVEVKIVARFRDLLLKDVGGSSEATTVVVAATACTSVAIAPKHVAHTPTFGDFSPFDANGTVFEQVCDALHDPSRWTIGSDFPRSCVRRAHLAAGARGIDRSGERPGEAGQNDEQ